VGEVVESIINKIFPHLKDNIKLAQMDLGVASFLRLSLILSFIFSLNFMLIFFFVVFGGKMSLLVPPVYLGTFILFFAIFVNLPRFNIARVKREIEADIFIPSRMLLILLESGNSLVTALEGAADTKANSSKYFGKIASEIYLGKNITQAIDDAIEFTPSKSFQRVLDPVRKSLRTGTNIQKNLYTTLQELSDEKTIEIEKYEKRLGALSMFFMLFGTIVPALGVVGAVLIMSILGINVEFFPFLLLLLLLILLVQMVFISLFRNIRPLMKL